MENFNFLSCSSKSDLYNLLQITELKTEMEKIQFAYSVGFENGRKSTIKPESEGAEKIKYDNSGMVEIYENDQVET